MINLLYLVFLCSNFLFIKSEDTGIVNIDVKNSENCTINSGGYTFIDGQNVSLVITPHMHIDLGWWNLTNTAGSRNLFDNLKTTENAVNDKSFESILHTSLVDKSMEGTWLFAFYYYKGNVNYGQDRHLLRRTYNNDEYIMSVCTTNVLIAPKPTTVPPSHTQSTPADPDNKFLIIASVLGAVLSAIIIAQAAYIFFLKAKGRKLITLNTHNSLSKKTEPMPNDTARYCSNPGQKMMKVAAPVDDDNRDSVIYEAPNIEISDNARMAMQPPHPPAITTIPRTPRSDHNMKIGPQAMLASALNSPSRSPMTDNFPPSFQRPKHERDVSVADRPPLPLPIEVRPHQGHSHLGHPHPGHPHPGHPHHNMFQEVYEEMEIEENTYEPPPVIHTMPPRLPMPEKKVPRGNFLDVKENTLKMRQGNKPLVTPKPQQNRSNIMFANEFEEALRRRNNDTIPKPKPGHNMTPMQQELAIRRRPNGAQTNELDEALRRRNNVLQVTSAIPDSSSRGSPKPNLMTASEFEEALRRRNNGPPPAVTSKPRGPPAHQPVQEDIYYNENQASSDEEWTYEPLKPLNSYDPNMYNV